MFQLERFVAAAAHFDILAQQYLAVNGVEGFRLSEAPNFDVKNPCGPVFVARCSDRKEVERQRLAKSLPVTVQTIHDEIDIVLVDSTVLRTSAHQNDENPIHPGASVSGSDPAVGTVGAVVSSPGSGDHFLTCGHVVEGSPWTNTDVYQAGLDHSRAAGRPDRKVGKVISNAFTDRENDSACVKLDTGFRLDPRPHDSPAPSSSHPAIGMVTLRDTTKNIVFLGHINKALSDCGASMDHTIQMIPQHKTRKIEATGAESGKIALTIDGPGRERVPRSNVVVDGFWTDPSGKGVPGDSGAVAVLLPRGPSIAVEDNGTHVDISAADPDDPPEYVPNAIPDLDKFINGDGTGFREQNIELTKKQGHNVLSQISAAFRSLGELEIKVSAVAFKNPCRAEGRRLRRPTAVQEIILKPGTTPEQPDPFDGMAEEVESDHEPCCTFGAKPFVIVAGEDSVEFNIVLQVTGTASVRVRYHLAQTVMSAHFLRHGSCWRNICEAEVMRGKVTVSRTSIFEIEGALGEIDLPVIGTIKAGSGKFSRHAQTTVEKKFELKC